MSVTLMVTLTLVLSVLFKVVTGVTECTTVNACSCKFDDGSMMDLTSLANTDNTPRFEDVLSAEGNYYSYNPCAGFTERECQDAATCFTEPSKTTSVQIGDATSAKFQYNTDSGNVVATYTAGDIGIGQLSSEVLLVCDTAADSPTFTAQGPQGGFFLMTLTTVCACPGGCNASGPTNGGISGGSIVLITFFAILTIYFGLGSVFMKFVKKRESVEIIPNFQFWRSMPAIIKAGAMFTFGLCIPCVYKCREEAYESK